MTMEMSGKNVRELRILEMVLVPVPVPVLVPVLELKRPLNPLQAQHLAPLSH